VPDVDGDELEVEDELESVFDENWDMDSEPWPESEPEVDMEPEPEVDMEPESDTGIEPEADKELEKEPGGTKASVGQQKWR